MYEVQSKLRNDDLREGWRPYPEGYTVLAEAMAGMGYEAEVNPHLMHRVVQKVDRVVAMMPELDTDYHPKETTDEDAS